MLNAAELININVCTRYLSHLLSELIKSQYNFAAALTYEFEALFIDGPEDIDPSR